MKTPIDASGAAPRPTGRPGILVPRLVPRLLTVAACVAAGLAAPGCQVDVGGQTLPSAYYLQDDIQYFPAGPEFKLSKEAAAQKAYKKELAERNDQGGYRP